MRRPHDRTAPIGLTGELGSPPEGTDAAVAVTDTAVALAEPSANGRTAPLAEPETEAPLAVGHGHGGGRRRSAYVGKDFTEGGIVKNLWIVSWPQCVESLLNSADQLLDLIWAGQLGAKSIAGLGVAQTYIQLMLTGRQGFDMSMRAMISRAVGAGNIARANHVAMQSFTLSGVFSLVMALIGLFFTEPLMHLVGLPASVVDAGAGYMRIQFLGSGTNAFRMMAATALQASGDTLTPMRAATLSRLLHVGLSPAFVFGWTIFPELGLVGAAVAAVIAQGAGAAMNFSALFRGTSRLHLKLSEYRLDPAMVWLQVKTGLPAAVTSAERSIAQLLLVGLVAPFGAGPLAAYSLTRRMENFVMMGARGFAQGAGVLVGQNLGAGKPDRARKTITWSLIIVLFLNLIVVFGLMLFPTAAIRVFNSDPELLDVAVGWLRIASIGYLFVGIGQVYQQSYNTAGDTMVPMFVTLISIWFVQEPLAFIMPDLGLSHYGIAWAVVVAVFVRLLIYAPYFFTNRWQRVVL